MVVSQTSEDSKIVQTKNYKKNIIQEVKRNESFHL